MIQNNYLVGVAKNGKHNLPGEYSHPPVDATLVIRKRVDNWLRSIMRKKVNLPKYRPELYPGGRLDTLKAHELHRSFYAEWYRQPCVVQVEYERLLRSPELLLGAVAARLEWRRHPGQPEFLLEGPEQVPEWRREMYLER
jgi:hypothetical protein